MTLTVRSVVVLVVAGVGGLGAFLWPLLARPDADFVPGSQTPLVLGALLVLILAVVGVELTSEGLDVRAEDSGRSRSRLNGRSRAVVPHPDINAEFDGVVVPGRLCPEFRRRRFSRSSLPRRGA